MLKERLKCLLSSACHRSLRNLRLAVMSDRGTSSVRPLAPVSLFEGLVAVVIFVRKVIRIKKLQDDTTISRLPSGHYSVGLMTFPRTGWNLPSTVSTEIGGYLAPYGTRISNVGLDSFRQEGNPFDSITQAPSSHAKRGRDHHHANCYRQAVRCTDSIGQCRQCRKMM